MNWLLLTVCCCISSLAISAESYTLNLVDGQTIIVQNGTESSIDFFLTGNTTLNKTIKIIVQHRSDGQTFHRKCLIEHSQKAGCQNLSRPCQCVRGKSGTFKYRLRIFAPQDAGEWLFQILDQHKVVVNIAVTSSTSMSSKDPPEQDSGTNVLTLTFCVLIAVVFLTVVFVLFVVILKKRGWGRNRSLFSAPDCVKTNKNKTDRGAARHVPYDDESSDYLASPCSPASEVKLQNLEIITSETGSKEEKQQQASSPLSTNCDGLIYGHLDFSDTTTSKRIISALPNTQYAEITFAASGQPIVNQMASSAT